MTLPEAIYAALTTGSPTPIADVGDRVSPYVRNATEQDFPAVVYEITSTDIESDSGGEVVKCMSNLTVTALARTFEDADDVAQDVLDTLTAYSNTSNCINLVTPQSVRRDQDMPYDGSQTLVYRTSVEFTIDHGNAL